MRAGEQGGGETGELKPGQPPRSPALAPSLLVAAGLAAGLGAVVEWLLPAVGIGLPSPEVDRLIGGVTLLAAAGLGCLGLGLLVFQPVLAGPEAAAAGFGSHRVVLTTTAFATLLAVLVGNIAPLLVLGVTGKRDLHNVPGFLAAALSVSAALLVVGYARFIRPGVVRLADFGFGRNSLAPAFGGRVWLAHLVSGLGGGLLILMLSGAVQALLRLVGVHQTQLDDYTWIRQLPPVSFALIFLAGAAVGPLAEEVYFRGLVFRAYLVAKGPLVAYLASAAVFGVLHLNPPAFLPIFVLGLALAWLYRATGSLVPGVLAHGLNNGVAFLVLYFLPQGFGM